MFSSSFPTSHYKSCYKSCNRDSLECALFNMYKRARLALCNSCTARLTKAEVGNIIDW